nr:copia protein [Tanacetum cinerariifolium]
MRPIFGVLHRPQPVPTGTPRVKPVPTGELKATSVPTGKPKVHLIPAGKPKFTPVPTSWLHRPFLVATDRGCSPLVPSAGEDEGIFDSGCSRNTECLVLSKDFKLLDDSMVVLKVPRKHNLYTINLNDLCPRENQLNKKVKAIRCDNGTEFKNAHMIELCGSKGIKREYIRTACYVLNRVFVTSPHNKTLYALLTGNIPTVSHFKPFGCHVTILNTSDHLGKFDGKAEEGYIVGYSTTNQSAGKQGNITNSIGTQDVDSDSDYDEQVIIVPSYPSNSELAKLKDQEQRVTTDAKELRTPAGVKAVLPGCIPVPTGRVPVPASSVPVPTGSITVTTDRILVPAGDTTVNMLLGLSGFSRTSEMLGGLQSVTRLDLLLKDIDRKREGLQGSQSSIWPSSGSESLNNHDIILVQVYVDDIIFGSTKKEWCKEFEALMKGEFQMSAVGELTFFLGLQVQQRPDCIFIHQDKYVQEILYKFDLGNVRIANTPYEAPKPKSKISTCLMHQVTPTTTNLEAVKKIFKYLKGQPKLGLSYPKESSLVLEAYSNCNAPLRKEDVMS